MSSTYQKRLQLFYSNISSLIQPPPMNKTTFLNSVSFLKTIDEYLLFHQNVDIFNFKQTLSPYEKRLYFKQEYSYMRKYYLLIQVHILYTYIKHIDVFILKLYPKLWKQNTESMDTFLKTNFEFPLSNFIYRLGFLKHKFYITEEEKPIIDHYIQKFKLIQNIIKKQKEKVSPCHFLQIFYKGNAQKINHDDICREIYSFI